MGAPDRSRRDQQGRAVWALVLLSFVVGACAADDPEPVAGQLSGTVAPTTAPGDPAETTGDAAEPTGDPAQDSGVSSEPASEIQVGDQSSATQTDPAETGPADMAVAEPADSGDADPSPAPDRRVAAPNGRTAPLVADTPEGLARQIIAAEVGIADPASSAMERADLGHIHQVAIRKLGYTPGWDSTVYEALPEELRARTVLHVSARRALIDLSSGYSAADFVPAWEIVEPQSAEQLLAHYQAAEAATGIEWEYLAAINLVETGMGRIRGLSSAGAQGPMQFLPTTWDEAGIGAGDINDPADAIAAAARYLVRRGGPEDMRGAIWGYNNSDNYVTAVRSYAELLREHPGSQLVIHNWEIYFFTERGDVWLPTGFRSDSSIDLDRFIENNPWSSPDVGLRQ